MRKPSLTVAAGKTEPRIFLVTPVMISPAACDERFVPRINARSVRATVDDRRCVRDFRMLMIPP